MRSSTVEIRVKGKSVLVPLACIDGVPVIVRGRWLKVASVRDEDYALRDTVKDPVTFVARLKSERLNADLFTFEQKLPFTEPKFDYHYEWDNVAAIPTASYQEWWTNRVSRILRQDVNRARKRGVTVRLVEFSDEFVHQVVEIYNEIPVRQGRTFWHYEKGFERVKAETGTYRDRSEFLGAYCNDELIGFMKITYDGDLGQMMQFSTKAAHNDKRPANALIAKAVERCEERRCSYLTYARYTYNVDNSLTAFKRRNGFEKILVPRYYVPLNLKGRVALRMGVHHGAIGMLPTPMIELLVRVRAALLWKAARTSPPGTPAEIGREAPGEASPTEREASV